MRTIVIAAAVGCFALASCTSKHTTIEQPAAAPAPVVVAPAAPTVYQASPVIVQPTAGRPATIAYTVMGQQQLDQASVLAANWCRANYDTDARLVDRVRSTAGDLVTFACVSG
jgi:hypothetical protein